MTYCIQNTCRFSRKININREFWKSTINNLKNQNTISWINKQSSVSGLSKHKTIDFRRTCINHHWIPQALLQTEPELLTFHGLPVQTVEEPYVHIGVPQATFKQSQAMADYRLEKGQNMSYKLQGVTKNSLAGVSPLSNRKMFLAYHQPSFLYGTDTMPINATDIERIEVKYRKTLSAHNLRVLV